uniref:DUF5577 domain-containing protein n=1 Tax=Varanus komodoensis TaxID=61221 RepID=A0A8D2LQT1_VARKO
MVSVTMGKPGPARPASPRRRARPSRPASPGRAGPPRLTLAACLPATSEWIQFFKEAGIPPGPAVNYAVMFVDNRIQKSMLMDLTKEVMNELGITIVGDIIAILKHAKVVYRQGMIPVGLSPLCSISSLGRVQGCNGVGGIQPNHAAV